MNQTYLDTARLLTQVAPLVLVDDTFALEDVYGGKLVAAMDRQHPRDLFDVMQLFAHEGITPGIRRAFVVYLASHNRPVHEVLFPSLRDIQYDYEHNFQGMTAEPVTLDALLASRERLVRELQQGLDESERRFLLSPVHRNGRCWASLISNICRESAGNCTTWCSCRRPMRRSSPNRPIRWLPGWPESRGSAG